MATVDIAAELRRIASTTDDKDIRDMAEKIADFEERRVDAGTYLVDDVLPVDTEWAELFAEVAEEGQKAASRMHITICGMARNIGGILPLTLMRLRALGLRFADFNIVVVENDSEDDTKEVLHNAAKNSDGKLVAKCQDFGWPHLHGFESARVERYAMLRNQYREIVATDFRHTDMVLAVDLDCWGGWSLPGLINGIGWMKRHKAAACMASTSLFQGLHIGDDLHFGHYDTWALRVHGWKHELSAWKTAWLPPPGSPPIEVFSAFGAAALYRPEAFFECKYRSIDGDIEHSGLHRHMIDRGWQIYLNPAQRSLMQWVPDAKGQHGDD